MLQVIQPGLAGLMDGSVSTLAPLFAAAFATRNSWETFLVGLAASLGAGISMGFAEALSDDGSLTGRGRPWTRGFVCGLMTALGGLGHTLPYLIPDFQTATGVAVGVVIVELGVISWIRHHFMDTPLTSGDLPGRDRRRPGLPDRHPDRQFLRCWRHACTGYCERSIRPSSPGWVWMAEIDGLTRPYEAERRGDNARDVRPRPSPTGDQPTMAHLLLIDDDTDLIAEQVLSRRPPLPGDSQSRGVAVGMSPAVSGSG